MVGPGGHPGWPQETFPDQGAEMLATIMSDEVRMVEATARAGQILIDPSRLPEALGWELKPEGMCRAETCVPLLDRERLFVGPRLDVAAVASALGRPAVVDAEAGIVAVALDAESRRQALDGLRAPPFVLGGLDGTLHRLEEWRNVKKLLVAFSSW